MATKHRMTEGEAISGLAADSGLLIETIWNDPNNSAVRSRRSSWDKIAPGDEVYVRDKELRTETGATETRHKFKKKIEWCAIIRLDLDPADEAHENDQFILKSTDGSYQVSKSIDDDMVPGDRFIDLHYSGLKRSKRYSLEIVPGNGDPRYTVFENVPYDDRTGLSASAGTPVEAADADTSADADSPYPDEPDEE